MYHPISHKWKSQNPKRKVGEDRNGSITDLVSCARFHKKIILELHWYFFRRTVFLQHFVKFLLIVKMLDNISIIIIYYISDGV